MFGPHLSIALQAKRIAVGMMPWFRIPPITRLQLTRNPLGDGYAANAASERAQRHNPAHKRSSDRNVLSDECWPVVAARRQSMSRYLRGRLKGEFGEFGEFVWVEIVF
jgi:hypothetical protein